MSSEVSAAGTAFAFLLDRYLEETLAPEVAVFVRPIVARRMALKPEARGEAVTPQIAARRNGLAEAKEHILDCVLHSRAIDRELLADMTGYASTEDIDRLIHGAIGEKHGFKAVVPGRSKRGPVTAEEVARRNATRAANKAKRQAE